MTWTHLGYPYCELSAARADAERFTERYPCVQVVNTVTGRVEYEVRIMPR